MINEGSPGQRIHSRLPSQDDSVRYSQVIVVGESTATDNIKNPLYENGIDFNRQISNPSSLSRIISRSNSVCTNVSSSSHSSKNSIQKKTSDDSSYESISAYENLRFNPDSNNRFSYINPDDDYEESRVSNVSNVSRLILKHTNSINSPRESIYKKQNSISSRESMNRHMDQRFRQQLSKRLERNMSKNDVTSETDSITSNGGQLYKICKQLEEQDINKPQELIDYPCAKGNVASLRAQLTPHLNFKGRSNKFIDPTKEDPLYMNIKPKPLQRQASKLMDEMHRKLYSSKDTISTYSNDSSLSEEYEVVDNFYVNQNFNNNSEEVCNKNLDDDGISDVTYESLEFSKIPVSNSELGYVDGGSNESLPIQAFNHAYGTMIQEIAESERRKYARELNDRINELIKSESFYIDKLRIVVEDYVPEMDGVDLPQNSEFTKDAVFSNIEEIHYIHHNKFHPQIKKNQRNLKKLANTFIEFEDTFKMYIKYAKNKNRANRIYHENKEFFATKQNAMGHRLNLASHLLEPIQRLPRYVLFLEEFEKSYKKIIEHADDNKSMSSGSSSWNGSASDGIDCNDTDVLDALKNAKQSVRNVLKKVDDNITLVNIKNCRINLEELGNLLLHDEFSVVPDSKNKKPWTMRCFLFEKSLVFTFIDKTQYKEEIYIYYDCIEMSVLGITPPENENLNKFSVWRHKRTEKNFELEATSKIITDWVNSISGNLWEEAKRQKEMIQSTQGERWRDSLSSVKRTTISQTLPRTSRPALPPKSAASTLGRDKSASLYGTHKMNVRKKKIRTTWYIAEDEENDV